MSTDAEVVEYAKRMRATAVASRLAYPTGWVPEPEWEMLDRYNQGAWISMARKLMKLEREETP